MHLVGTNPTLNLQRDLELIDHLDRLGYDEAWIGEHHSAGAETIASPEVMIAAAAQRTRHIKLGTGVMSLPYHHPLVLADRIVLLDHLTRGRMMFGVGPGQLTTDARCSLVSMPSMHASVVSCPGPTPNIMRPLRQVIEHDDAIGEHQRVVVGQRHHAGAELDVSSALRGRGDHHLGRCDRLGARGVVLTDPGLVVAEAVEVLDQLEITLQVERRVRADPVHRRQEDPESKRP